MSRRILIIDDEENIRRVTRLTLQAAGYEVGEAGDGERGLEAFGNGSAWDAVLLDQRMPGMDGLETLRQIKERQPDARVIMSTAYASIELAVDAMKLGATDFVRKPMTPEILRNAVAASLSKQPSIPRTSAPASQGSSAAPLIQTIHDERLHDPGIRRCLASTERAPLHGEEPYWRASMKCWCKSMKKLSDT